jgi:hypothetical protein
LVGNEVPVFPKKVRGLRVATSEFATGHHAVSKKALPDKKYSLAIDYFPTRNLFWEIMELSNLMLLIKVRLHQ